MNKTININLANVFFHIDEDAFMKLDKYLKTIENYLSHEESKEEILQDIEARIAELFTESLAHQNQVVTMTQVDMMISIMGEPEAYKIDDEESASSSSSFKTPKKLYRDIDHNYVGGVSAGLYHYLGLSVIIIRLIWIISAVFSFGATVLIYAILWAVIPAARTTSQKLDMHGEPVNLSNIEKKVKESYSKFADKVGGIDYEKYEKQTKSGVTKFFDGLGDVFRALGIFISKFIGVILLIISGSTLIALVIFLFSFGTISLFELGDLTNADVFPLGIPYWIQVTLFFLAFAIPFFYLLILSLKLLISNLRSIGKVSHITLVGLWILSIIAITTFGVKNQMDHSFNAQVDQVESYKLVPADTLRIQMDTDIFNKQSESANNYEINSNMSKFYNISVYLRTNTTDDLKVNVRKRSFGANETKAREKASQILYDYDLENSTLELDRYFYSNEKFAFKTERVVIDVYVPEHQIVVLDESLMGYLNIRDFRNRIKYNTYLGFDQNSWKPIDSITKIDSISTQN